MNSSRPPIVNPDKVREEICAYLDGELPAEDGREVEERLAAEPHFRDELQGMERAWRLLDELPHTEADEKFAATTVEMVAVRAADDLRQQQEQWPKLFVRGWVLSAGGMLLALLLGFGVVAGGAALLSQTGAIETPDDRLLADLSVLLKLDEYQQVGGSDFVRALEAANLFAPDDALPREAPIAESAKTEPGASLTERRQYVEGLTPYERKDLAERRERFLALPEETQTRLRTLERELAADPRAAELREVLDHYGEWLMTLSLEARAELRRLPQDERVAKITELRQQDSKKKERRYAAQDLRVTLAWLQEVAKRNEESLTQQSLPPGPLDTHNDAGPMRRMRLVSGLLQSWQRNGFGKNPAVTAAEFDKLKQNLSPSLRKRMEQKGGDMAAQWEALTSALLNEARPSGPGLEPRRPLDASAVQPQHRWPMLLQLSAARAESVDDQELWNFFHQLPRNERDRIKRLPREEGLQALRTLYARTQRERGDESWDGRHNPDGPGGPRRLDPGRAPRPAEFGPRPGDFRDGPELERRGPGRPGGPRRNHGPRENGPDRPEADPRESNPETPPPPPPDAAPNGL